MPKDFVDQFLDALKESFIDTTRDFADRVMREQMPQAPRARRVSSKAPKQPKPPKAAKVKRDGPTLYDALECSPRASRETIEAAYKSLARRNHPDVSKSKHSEERMKILNNAKDILLDAAKRKAYDRSIGL